MAELTIGDAFVRSVNNYPSKTALIFESRRLTYSELNQRVNQLANGLLALGYQKGDKLSVLLHNGIEITEVVLACAKTGIIAVPISTRFKESEVQYIIEQSDSRGIIFEDEFLPIMESLYHNVQLKEYIRVGYGSSEKDLYKNYEEFLHTQPLAEPNIDIHETDTWYIGYTSGTTGFPKGAIISHRTRVLHILYKIIEYGLSDEDVQMLVMPQFHSNGLTYGVLGLVLGNTVFIMKQFDAEKVLVSIEREGLTYSSMVPTMYNMILNLPNEIKSIYDVSSMRVLISSSSPLLTVTKEGILGYFHSSKLFEFYGSAEAGIATVLKPQDQYRKIRSVGKPMFGIKVKLLDDAGNEVPQGEVGELYSFGPVTDGYYKMPDKTEESFRNGWFSAGDLARVDDEGYFYIVDRKKDMIISGGENIYPVEIEEVLSKHPSVQEVAVIGIPNNIWGEQVHALIVCRDCITEEEIIDFCRDKMAGFKRPRSVEFVQSLPKSPTGKILKRIIREKYWEGKEAKI
ncbi:class I adenylate-forming enzyme family protein [Bacillus sp. FJAT-29814]|uniref:class I adenylate-forming enzyme family protein n=1 Tax=Bacillus sp. FJAT-29814 TaxID=1729688 RepID=UPI0008307DCF|nr:long-chain-fatty-acid--CoA ligase [Bacillus sp. FJAT-29814]